MNISYLFAVASDIAFGVLLKLFSRIKLCHARNWSIGSFESKLSKVNPSLSCFNCR